MDEGFNDQLVLISGESGTGKTASLRSIPNQERWLYMNCEAGKRLPFRNSFKSVNITDPRDVLGYFDQAITHQDKIDGVVIDTFTFLMERYESVYINTAANTMKAWGSYGEFIRQVYQDKIPRLPKPVIIFAHTKAELDEALGLYKVSVPLKGAAKNQGLEAYHSIVVSTKKVPLKELEAYDGNKLLDITQDDVDQGYKHVFQTRPTKATTQERIRAPLGMFTREETFIDNDVAKLLTRLKEYYG
jgi:hypothetical protein